MGDVGNAAVGAVNQALPAYGAVVGGGIAGIPGAIAGSSIADNALHGGLEGVDIKNRYRAGGAQLTEADYAEALRNSMNLPSQTATQQAELANQLRQQAAGTGPQADMNRALFQQALERNQQQMAGMAASQRGLNPALAQRQLMQNQASVGQQAAGQYGLLSNQSRLGAQAQLGNLLGQQRQQDVAQLGVLGGLQNQQNQIRSSNMLGAEGINAGVAAGNAQTNAGLLGGLMGGVGAGLQMLLSNGGQVPGKAMYGGDDPENDTVPAMLSPGEIVIPRSKAKDPEKAKEFIDHLMGQEKEEMSFAEVLKAHENLEKRMSKLEKSLK